MAILYLIRHGETEFNVEGRLQGCACDSPLTAKGKDQARQVGAILRGILPAAPAWKLVSSPLGRTRATAEIVLEVLGRARDGYETDDRLRELDFGDWTGLRMADVEQERPAEWSARAADPWNVPPPGGETYAQVAARVAAWSAEQAAEVVAVAHGVVGRILRGVALGLDGPGIRALDEPQDCVFRIEGAKVHCIR